MGNDETTAESPDWFLVMGDLRLGALWLRDVDQPWYICRFEPYAAYDTVRPLFEASEAASQAGDLDGSIDLLDELASNGVRLIWANGQAEPRPDLEGSLQSDGGDMLFRPDRVTLARGAPAPD